MRMQRRNGFPQVKKNDYSREKSKAVKMQKIIVNRTCCKHCVDIFESHSTHDFKTCSCGAVSVDGGHDYIRRTFKEKEDFEELSNIQEWVIIEVMNDKF